MALKPDLSGLRSFLFEKGEKIALIACLAGAGVLVTASIMNGMNAKHAPGTKQTYPQHIKQIANELKSKHDRGEEVDPKDLKDSKDAGKFWGPEYPVIASTHRQGRLFEFQDRIQTKRLNPRALGILADKEKDFQIDYIRGSYFAFDVHHQFKTATVVKDKTAAVAKDPFNPFGKKQASPMNQSQGLTPVIAVHPKRMLVVSAVFPLEQQLDEFRKAFRMMSQADLFASKDLPRFLGINVMKAEITPGQPVTWKPLIQHNPTNDRVDVDPKLMETLRAAIFDETQNYASSMQGLTMPLPKLAGLPLGTTYPEVKLANIVYQMENAVGGGGVGMPAAPAMKMPAGMGGMGGMPAMAGGKGGGLDVEFESKKWDLLVPDIRERLYDRFYPLDPTGVFPDPNEGLPQTTKSGSGEIPNPGFRGTPGPNQPGMSPYLGPSMFAATAFWTRYPQPHMPGQSPAGVPGGPFQQPGMAMQKPFDALVRFVDVDVVPGKTYKYSIQVRIANPNYLRKNDVAYPTLAEHKELPPAPFVETPSKTIPEEYFLYAIDQKPDNPKIIGGSDDKDAKPDQVAVQIHVWTPTTSDAHTGADYVIADWTIAERLLVRRGDIIGRGTNIEIPVWDKKKQAYDLGLSMVGEMPAPAPKNKFEKPPVFRPGQPQPQPKKAAGAELGAVGIPVSFVDPVSLAPAVLADFDGGKRTYSVPGTQTVKDESASNLLILTGDGRLIVRNSRDDSLDTNPEYRVRQQRIEEWKAKVAPFRANAPANPGGDPARPNNPFLKGRGGD